MKSRNRLQRISFLVLSLAALVHGCAWDDSLYNEFVIDNGSDKERVQGCENLKVIRIYDDNNNYTDYDESNSDGKYANAFKYNLCPRVAPNCMHAESKDADSKDKIGICRNDCPKTHAICKDKCLEKASKTQETDSDEQNNNIKFHSNLHIQSCNDDLICEDDYYDLDKDVVNGCEFQLSTIHVKKDKYSNKLVCNDDEYYDLNDDLEILNGNGKLKDNQSFDGCEFQLSLVHVTKDSNNKFVCNDDEYYDLNDDLEILNGNGKLKDNQSFDGCEFQLSLVHVTKDLNGNLVCLDGYADIDKKIDNGCEIDGRRDNKYCGAGINNNEKGEKCIDTPCVDGVCTETCNYTDLVRCGDYCVNVYGSDNAHCGGCNQKCEINDNTPSSTAAVTCGGGYCHATACMPGYRLNVNPNNNDTNNFPNTCTKCNPDEYTTSAMATECKKCPKTPGASTMKFDTRLNMCVPKTCKSGWYYHDPCANSSNNKCTEAAYCDTTQHCTSSAQCANLSAGTSACVNGKCEYACNAGWYYSLNGCTNPPYCCQKCPNGTYKASSDALCTAVPAGKIGYPCDNTSPRSGCRNYQSCSTTDQCKQMYGSSSRCSSSSYKCRTTINSSYYDSCNTTYDGCPSGKTCKAYDQSTYGYCN